jgi:hypothetical protein
MDVGDLVMESVHKFALLSDVRLVDSSCAEPKAKDKNADVDGTCVN